MKYVINGGISTAITLFGMSYLYGVTGSVNLGEMSRTMAAMTDGQLHYGPAFFMVFVGLSFKIAAAPFHMWAPDVYEGAPTPVVAFLSVISKIAGFVIILRIFLSLFLNRFRRYIRSARLFGKYLYSFFGRSDNHHWKCNCIKTAKLKTVIRFFKYRPCRLPPCSGSDNGRWLLLDGYSLVLLWHIY